MGAMDIRKTFFSLFLRTGSHTPIYRQALLCCLSDTMMVVAVSAGATNGFETANARDRDIDSCRSGRAAVGLFKVLVTNTEAARLTSLFCDGFWLLSNAGRGAQVGVFKENIQGQRGI